MKNLIIISFLLSTPFAFTKEIVITGNTKTHKEVILNEIKDIIEPVKIEEIKRRLWNLRVFSNVEVNESEKKVTIKVEERWTTIPIAKFSSGGGSSYYALGLYDINTKGLNLELGGQYESLNGKPAGVLWLRKPQFLTDRQLKFGIDLWDINRVRVLYDLEGEEFGAFTLKRKRLNSFLEKNWKDNFYTLNLSFDYHQDEISDFGITDKQKDLNEQNGLIPDSKSLLRFYTLAFEIGRLDFKNYLVEGTKLNLASSFVEGEADGNNQKLSSHKLEFNHFKLWENNNNLGFKFLFAKNNINLKQYKNFLGGLSEVRGYRDGQFYGNSYWHSNLEYRFDVHENKYGIVQGVAFSDQGKEFKGLDNTFENNEEILLSSGFGIRLISPKIYRFVARIDYAQTHTRFINQNISFGVQQFF